MSLAPELVFLERVAWQAFVTLTFAGRVPSSSRRLRLLHAWLASLEAASRVPFGQRLLWLVREEKGGRGGRAHYHVLIGGVPSFMVTWNWLYSAKGRWKAGFSDVRLWSEGLGALGYIAKDAGNEYESARFLCATGLILSESLLRVGSTGDFVGREDAQQVEKPVVQVVRPDNASLDYPATSRQIGGASILSLAVESMPYRLFPSRVPVYAQVQAVNASDQGLTITYGSGHHRRQ